MRFVRFVSALAGVGVVSACSTPAPAPEVEPVYVPPPVVVAPPPPPPPVYTVLVMTPGVYRCELNRQVTVRQVSADRAEAIVGWNQRDYTLRMVNTSTGALRYEDQASGLTWIGVSGKSMLLDTKNGRQLANECRA